MPLPQQTLIGNLTADPELRFIPSGKAVANFTVACSERRLNQQTQEWEDGDSFFVRCNAWEEMAENIVESCIRGTSVIVTGPMLQRSYEDKDGQKRYSVECRVRTFGVQVSRSQTVKVNKIQRSGSYDGGQGDAPPPDDPWGTSPSQGSKSSSKSSSSGNDDPWGNSGGGTTGQSGFSDEPPF